MAGVFRFIFFYGHLVSVKRDFSDDFAGTAVETGIDMFQYEGAFSVITVFDAVVGSFFQRPIQPVGVLRLLTAVGLKEHSRGIRENLLAFFTPGESDQ
jgi:hypothetical protein